MEMVRKERLELSRLAALEPKSSASANSATSAYFEPFSPKSRNCQSLIYNEPSDSQQLWLFTN